MRIEITGPREQIDNLFKANVIPGIELRDSHGLVWMIAEIDVEDLETLTGFVESNGCKLHQHYG